MPAASPRQAALDPRGRASSGAGAPPPSLAQRAAHEAGRYLSFAAYLLVIFGTLILFSVNIYARADQDVPHFPSYHFYALGLINALVLAKFMLIAEAAKLGALTVGRRLEEGPLAYVILYRSLLFMAVLVAAYVLEELLVGAWHGKPPRAVLPEMAGGPRGLASFAWVMFVALIPYFTYREIDRATGGAWLRALLMKPAGRRAEAAPGPDAPSAPT
ncbi:hypothetical protein DA075_20925 [Methylobacterium currus]|jgi:hypothetical protein|uniref:DUF2975 domain-containing protein n=1 Tax=Methylobacterium currus TaxID=2051553 RepID=A0A2R4WNE1_9HYPH|nr:hypothetical protein [Methylobacterium currus]AWB23060.1 hypothetical protein DA075_20925 [Methylobacterium currus]UHC17088.1 hypothetical protein LRS73_04010 [Methylobacterium currus]